MTPPLAVALTDYDAWFAVHSTAWCQRMAVRITAAACDKHRHQPRSDGEDFRCFGCGGLDQQPDPAKPVLTIIQGGLDPDGRGDRDDDETWTQAEIWEEPENTVNTLASGLLAFLQEHGDDDEFEESEPDQARAVWRELLDIPELRGKVAVFTGRCIRCDGGMLHAAREGLDNAVYHCFNCGWYTSPGYEENRRAGARGW
jgi:hypothetical protein